MFILKIKFTNSEGEKRYDTYVPFTNDSLRRCSEAKCVCRAGLRKRKEGVNSKVFFNFCPFVGFAGNEREGHKTTEVERPAEKLPVPTSTPATATAVSHLCWLVVGHTASRDSSINSS